MTEEEAKELVTVASDLGFHASQVAEKTKEFEAASAAFNLAKNNLAIAGGNFAKCLNRLGELTPDEARFPQLPDEPANSKP